MNWKAELYDKSVAALAPILTRIIPKKKNYFVFVPTHDYKNILSGNSLALLQYIRKNHTEVRCELVLLNKKNINIPEEEKGLVVNRSSLSIYWSILRAQHIIIDTVVFHPLIVFGKYSIIQLWHGTGFKNIGILAQHTQNFFFILKKQAYQFKLVVATSESNVIQQNSSFQIQKATVTGYPRNDMFFEDEDYFQKIRIKFKVENYDRVISYLPTFRDNETIAPFSDEFWKKLNDFLIKNNHIFIVKKHPWDKYLIVPDNYSNIKDYSQFIKNSQELLLITDLLISDYSSMITDFVITNRPILLYMYDLDLYIANCRSMYYALEEVLPKPFIFDEEELLNRIMISDWTEESEYKESYKAFKQKFHKYLDGNSSKRVTEAILKL